jgi:transposase-like protein
MRDRPPVCASWPERLTTMPCAVTLSMSLGDFVEAFEKSRLAWPVRRPVSRGSSDPRDRATERAEGDPRGSAPSTIHFPLELTEPRSIVLPAIPQDGRGRPAALTNARAEKVIAMACTGASIPACAAAAGVTPNTLKSWLRRKDHEAYVLFQGCFAEALTYATLTALRSIMEGVASNPKHAFAFLARRDPDRWRADVG